MPKVLRTCQILISLCLFSSAVNASTIVLDSGLMVMGKIIERSPTRITIDVEGSPETFFLGEVRSIDGQTIEIPQIKHQLPVGPGIYATGGTKTIVVPYYEGEEDSLIKFMTILSKQNATSKISIAASPATNNQSLIPKSSTLKSSVAPKFTNFAPQAKPAVPVVPSPSSTPPTVVTMPADTTNKNILTTSDGGIIVVSQAKITKFDKDLNVIKQVNLNQPPQ